MAGRQIGEMEALKTRTSQVAKQAAEKIHDLHLALWEAGGIKLGEVSNIIQQAIDTATAKLREELEQTRENLYAGLDRDSDDITTPHLATVAVNALALAREEWEWRERQCADLVILAQEMKLIGQDINPESILARLAHQQPSAFVGKKPCKSCGVLFFEDEKECPHCAESRQPSEGMTHDEIWDVIHGVKQPSAPTADVEKIARELWAECSNETDLKTILDYFAQVRAPLVKALRKAQPIVWQWEMQTESGQTPLSDFMRAALTGTGEKKCPK